MMFAVQSTSPQELQKQLRGLQPEKEKKRKKGNMHFSFQSAILCLTFALRFSPRCKHFTVFHDQKASQSPLPSSPGSLPAINDHLKTIIRNGAHASVNQLQIKFTSISGKQVTCLTSYEVDIPKNLRPRA